MFINIMNSAVIFEQEMLGPWSMSPVADLGRPRAHWSISVLYCTVNGITTFGHRDDVLPTDLCKGHAANCTDDFISKEVFLNHCREALFMKALHVTRSPALYLPLIFSGLLCTWVPQSLDVWLETLWDKFLSLDLFLTVHGTVKDLQ